MGGCPATSRRPAALTGQIMVGLAVIWDETAAGLSVTAVHVTPPGWLRRTATSKRRMGRCSSMAPQRRRFTAAFYHSFIRGLSILRA